MYMRFLSLRRAIDSITLTTLTMNCRTNTNSCPPFFCTEDTYCIFERGGRTGHFSTQPEIKVHFMLDPGAAENLSRSRKLRVGRKSVETLCGAPSAGDNLWCGLAAEFGRPKIQMTFFCSFALFLGVADHFSFSEMLMTFLLIPYILRTCIFL